jgi:coenzyme Q-binding protein COQ10
MPTHAERRILPFTPDQLYALVSGIELYPQFLPWCLAARVNRRERDGEGREVLVADMVIGFKVFRERFTSKVTLDPERRTIHVAYVTGPMKHMTNRWVFLPDPGGCEVDFFVDFEFRSRLLQKTIELLFHEAVKRMVAAFEARARQLYGAKT